jgi:hypothetical protein
VIDQKATADIVPGSENPVAENVTILLDPGFTLEHAVLLKAIEVLISQ